MASTINFRSNQSSTSTSKPLINDHHELNSHLNSPLSYANTVGVSFIPKDDHFMVSFIDLKKNGNKFEALKINRFNMLKIYNKNSQSPDKLFLALVVYFYQNNSSQVPNSLKMAISTLKPSDLESLDPQLKGNLQEISSSFKQAKITEVTEKVNNLSTMILKDIVEGKATYRLGSDVLVVELKGGEAEKYLEYFPYVLQLGPNPSITELKITFIGMKGSQPCANLSGKAVFSDAYSLRVGIDLNTSEEVINEILRKAKEIQSSPKKV